MKKNDILITTPTKKEERILNKFASGLLDALYSGEIQGFFISIATNDGKFLSAGETDEEHLAHGAMHAQAILLDQ